MPNRLPAKTGRLAESIGAVVTPEEVAKYLGVDKRTIQRWVASGRLPKPDIRVGPQVVRWKVSTIEAAIVVRPEQ